MRSFKPSLTPELEKHNGGDDPAKAPAYPIRTYRQLVEQVAHLSFLNRNQLLFYRGQGKDYENKAGASTFYPPIYRGEYVTSADMVERFRVLNECSRQLKTIFRSEGFEGAAEVSRREYVRWSILQHYQVCDTPLLDITHSIRVACSFAEMYASGSSSYVYVFGLPYLTGRISVNSEKDIVNVRLLSICPPQALRPYFQEGYLCGTTDIRDEYSNKGELDFKRRLIAKFHIQPSARFWGRGFQMIPESVLFPRGDAVERACKSIAPPDRSAASN
jgi:hypothetical protein